MLQKLRILALGLAVLGVYPQAQAEVITISNLSVGASNVGPASLTSSSSYISTYLDLDTANYSNTTKLVTEIAEQPTTTLPGLEKDYEINTIKYDNLRTSYKRDNLQAGILSPDSGLAGGKYLTLSGSVTSTIATTVYFDLSAFGTYLPGTSPFGGASVPALASLYLGSSLNTLAPTAYSTAYVSAGSTSYTVNNGWSYAVVLAAGETLTFTAGIAAPTDASLTELRLGLQSAYYDYQTVTTPYEYQTKTLVDARAIPPLPVPENSSYAMLLAGIGMISLVRRRSGKAGQQ